MKSNPPSDVADGPVPRRDVSYLPMTPQRGVRAPELPTPAAYRQTTPAVLGPPPSDEKSRLFTRRRVVIGFGVAVLLHVILVLGWWLTPPLRLKAGYAPERWVPVLSLPKPPPQGAPPPSAPLQPGAAPLAAAPTTQSSAAPAPGKKPAKSHANADHAKAAPARTS